MSVGPEDTLLTAFNRFKLNDVSQLPVLEGEKIVGIIDEYDVLRAVRAEPSHFRDLVRKHMTADLETLAPGDALDQVIDDPRPRPRARSSSRAASSTASSPASTCSTTCAGKLK